MRIKWKNKYIDLHRQIHIKAWIMMIFIMDMDVVIYIILYFILEPYIFTRSESISVVCSSYSA